MLSHIRTNIIALKKEVNDLDQKLGRHTPTEIVIATKYATLEETQAILDAGITHIAENKVQELERKKKALHLETITLHMLGHLQTNKINKCLTYANCIDSFDSIALLDRINSKLVQTQSTIHGLVQVNIGDDDNKFGFSENDILENHATIFGFSNIIIKGIMIIAPLTDSTETRVYFKKAKLLFDKLHDIYRNIDTLSMGMSNDYRIAIEEGATQIRVGRRILNKE